MPSIINLVENIAPDGANNNLAHNEGAKEKIQHLVNGQDASEFPLNKPYSTTLPNVAITLERQPYVPKDGDKLIDPGVARVNVAASCEAPEGTPGWAEEHKHQTVLQQHCTYWDPDQDGVIYPWDIYIGCRAWGWNLFLALLAVIIISPTLSYPTAPKGKWLPSPFFPIYLDNIHKDKHGSDTNTYDPEGRFRPQQFEDLFAKYDKGNKGGLDMYDLARMHKGQRIALDPFGWTANVLEWLALYLLIWPDDGIMRKEDIRGSFDGSIFQRKADEYAAQKAKKNKAS